MEKDKIAAKQAYDALPCREKIKHIWHYYRVHIISVVAVVLMTVSIIFSCLGNIEPDLTVIILSRIPMSNEAREILEERMLPHIQDANGDQEITVSINIISFDPEVTDEIAIASVIPLDGQLTSGDVKLLIADEVFLEWFKERNGNVIEQYAEITNMPRELQPFGPWFVIERIEYTRHMRGRMLERKTIQHENARAVFESFIGTEY